MGFVSCMDVGWESSICRMHEPKSISTTYTEMVYRVLGITDDIGELILSVESLGLPSKHWNCSICEVHLKGTTHPFTPWARQKDAKLRWDVSHYYVHHYAFWRQLGEVYDKVFDEAQAFDLPGVKWEQIMVGFCNAEAKLIHHYFGIRLWDAPKSKK